MSNSHLVPAPAFLRPGLCIFPSLTPNRRVGGAPTGAFLFIVVAPASASAGRAGDARIASSEAAPDALAFRRSTVAVARHVPLRLRIISGNALNERDANVLLQMRIVVKRKMRSVARKIRQLQPSPHWQER
jgi:hypothetical protein